MLSEGKLEELEKVARAAPLSGYRYSADESEGGLGGHPRLRHCVGVHSVGHVPLAWAYDEKAAQLFATFDPPTVLALISELRALRAERDEAWHELSCCDDIGLSGTLATGISELQSDRERLRVVAALRAQAPAPVGGEVVEAEQP